MLQKEKKMGVVTVIDIDDNAMRACFSYLGQWEQRKVQFTKGIL